MPTIDATPEDMTPSDSMPEDVREYLSSDEYRAWGDDEDDDAEPEDDWDLDDDPWDDI